MAPEEELPEETPQEPTPEAPPSIDLNAAIEAVSQHYGWDPRVADYELRELGQKKAQIDQKARELQALEERVRRSNAYDTPPGYEADPTYRTLAQLAQEMREDREERRREREEATRSQQLTRDLSTSYGALMARVPNKVDERTFFNAMLEVYPDQALLDKVGIDRAVQVVYRYIQSNPLSGNGYQPAPRPSRREPIIIPGGTSGGAGAPSDTDSLTPPVRGPNEPEAEYRDRYNAWTKQFAAGFGSLRDGQRVSSG